MGPRFNIGLPEGFDSAYDLDDPNYEHMGFGAHPHLSAIPVVYLDGSEDEAEDFSEEDIL